MGVALILAILTIAGVMSPWILLVLTFALSAGDAFETPTWRAILPELVPKEDLAAASALNGIEFNLARAVGPALAGTIISVAGVAAAFVANFVSFFGVILVVARWKRPVRRRSAPPESFSGATVAAIRYVRPLSRNPDGIAQNRRSHVLLQRALRVTANSFSERESDMQPAMDSCSACFGAVRSSALWSCSRPVTGGRWKSIVSTGVVSLGLVILAMRGLAQIEHTGCSYVGWRCGMGHLHFPYQCSCPEPGA